MSYLNALSDPAECNDRLFAFTGTLAFDVGANAGHVAMRLAQHFGRVVAFEPAEESYEQLLRNVCQLPVVTRRTAVSDQTGTVRLREAEVTRTMGELVTGDSMPQWGNLEGWREVPSITLDDATIVYGCPDLVKIDTEGHELNVLWGASRLLAAKKTTWFVEVHAEAHDQPIRQLLSGYAVERIRHSGYAEGTDADRRHFYLIATPT